MYHSLMGQDEIYLEVLHSSGDEYERKHAGKVLRLLKRGKHWVLVTLLLSNVITNETLPIILDRSLGGGWPAVVSSTALIGVLNPHRLCVMVLTLGSNFWRSHPTVNLCSLWSPNRRLPLIDCSRTDVHTFPIGLANSQTPGLPLGRRSRDHLQESRPQDSCYTSHVTRQEPWRAFE